MFRIEASSDIFVHANEKWDLVIGDNFLDYLREYNTNMALFVWV
jgi:hypothetical protein